MEEYYIDEINDESLKHYGTPRHSGRYPWGSGDSPYQHSEDFLSAYDDMHGQGLTDKEIADYMGCTTTVLKNCKMIAVAKRRKIMVDKCRSLKEDGLGATEIGKRLGIGESSVRSYLNEDIDAHKSLTEKTAESIKKIVDEKGIVDIGKGVSNELGITQTRLDAALMQLELDGYPIYNVRVQQANNKGQYTIVKTIGKPGTEWKDSYDFNQVGTLVDYESTDGETLKLKEFYKPASLDSSRLKINYAEEGGLAKDGTIEIRRGVKDLELDGSNYSQVRILVDDSLYLKGMAVYSDDLPDGVDIMFNTNKTTGTPLNKVLKPIKSDPDNPFGATIKPLSQGGQHFYDDPDGEYTDPLTGNKQSLSLINKKSDEGDWEDWSDKLPSQFLGKQSISLIKQQLNTTINNAKDELNDIESLENPTLKRAFLEDYAENRDSNAVDLKAAPLAGQKYKVILPINSLKDNECYCPSYEDGTVLALVRYPHGGIFEIPYVTVNNKNEEGQSKLGTVPKDCIGIRAETASQLSGADFDGDTVMILPVSESASISHSSPLKGLKDFDPKMSYGSTKVVSEDGTDHYYRNDREYKIMSDTQKQMGVISNLITDMTLKGADDEELARAVRHSMVVIDAEKHKLDYESSEIDNGIQALKDKYQIQDNGHAGGASTLLSRAKSQLRLPLQEEGAYYTKDEKRRVDLIDYENQLYSYTDTGEVVKLNSGDTKKYLADPNTGEKVYSLASESKRLYYKSKDTINGKKQSLIKKDGSYYYKDVDGTYIKVDDDRVKTIERQTITTKMAGTSDAKTLLSNSNNPKEALYADFANANKALANKARKEALECEDIPYSAEAKKKYATEVDSLIKQIAIAEANAPRERKAQMMVSAIMKQVVKENPDLDDEHIKKRTQKELVKARDAVGAKGYKIIPTAKEWEAIQAGAVSTNRLKQIIAHSDKDALRQLAMPKNKSTISTTKQARIKSLANSGYTTAEIAKTLGISASTVSQYIK